MISIIVAARNEEQHLKECIDSLLAQSYQDFEILIIDGKSDDATLKIAKRLAKQHKNIRVYENPAQRAAEARNIGFNKAKGDYLCYIDAHTTAKKTWLETLYKTFEKHKTWKGKAVGGVGSVHSNPNKEHFSTAVTHAFQHPLGGGGSSYRVGGKLRAVDTSYACMYSKEALKSIQMSNGDYYDTRFVKGQDAELNWRINKAGYVLLQNPKAMTYYFKRSNWKGLWKQMLVAGFWRSKLSKKHPELLKPTLYAPLVFYLFTILCIIFAPLIGFALLALYGLTILLSCIAQRRAVTVASIIITIHFAYTIGLIKGMIFTHNKVQDRVWQKKH